MSVTIVIVVTLACIHAATGQENAQLRVPRSLEECYKNPELLQRDNLLPMTIQTLIDLVRKVENTPGFNQDMRQLSVGLLHRFRQDGIIRAPYVPNSPDILPYSPADFQFPKHKLLLSRLIQGNANGFPNSTLTPTERCTLHVMLSSSIDRRVRGDEGQRCSQLAQFKALRLPRSAKDPRHGKSNFVGDVELIENLHAKVKTRPSGKMSFGEGITETPPIMDYDHDEIEYSGADFGLVDLANDAVSSCPVESGVVWTPWGTVNAGTVIAGIAAGLQPQRVQLRTLLKLSRRSGGHSAQQGDVTIDNKWAATLAGDLAEVALLQAPFSQVTVGAPGAWNSTTLPKWYFLTKKERLEMTDAEIRGGLDGLIIASKINEWKNKAPSMKLSQLLDMYYSQRGVLDSGVKACDRRLVFSSVAKPEEIKAQANYFANVLDRELVLRVTMYPEAIANYTNLAADALSVYIPQFLNDPSCQTTAPTPNDPTILQTATDLYVFLDTTWQHREISPILGHIWSNIEMGESGSRVTLLNAADGPKIIVNTTSSASNMALWNATSHDTFARGFNLPSVLKTLQNMTMSLMEQERVQTSSGGRSLIALMVVQNGLVNEADANFAAQTVQMLREQVPDLKIIFMAAGALNRFAPYVKEEAKDLFSVRTSDNPVSQANPVIKRIREVPKRFINHRCGSIWRKGEYGQSTLNQFLTPGAVSFYRLHPNYFFKLGANKRLRVQGKGGPALTVCTSRQVELPRANASSNSSSNATQGGDLNCRQITTDVYEVNLDNPCEAYSMIHQCPPLHFSVEAKPQTGNGQARCQDVLCQYPDQIPFTIQADNLDCFSGVGCNLGSFSTLALLLYLVFLLQ